MTQPRSSKGKSRLFDWLTEEGLEVKQYKSQNGTCPYGYYPCKNKQCESNNTKKISYLVLDWKIASLELKEMKLTPEDVLARDRDTLRNGISHLFTHRFSIPNDDSGEPFTEYFEKPIEDAKKLPPKKSIKHYLEVLRPGRFSKKLDALVELFGPSDDEKFTQALLAKDKNSVPPLHYLFLEPDPYAYKPKSLFSRITQIKNIEYKKNIAMGQDEQHENIFHKAIKYGTSSYLQAWIDTFSAAVAREVWSDRVEETGFHCLFQSPFSVPEKLKIMVSAYEHPAQALAIIEMKNTKGHTALHSAAIHDKTLDGSYIKALRSVFQKASSEDKKDQQPLQWAKDLAYKDEKGNTALHYICSNGNADAMIAALEGLTKDQIKKLMAIRNNAQELPFHRICKYGNRLMFDRCVEVMAPWDLARLIKDSKTEKLLRQNNHPEKLSKQDVDLTAKTVLYDCFEYFENNATKIGKPNFELRSKDFVKCVIARAKGDQIDYDNASQFNAKSYVFFKGTETYQTFRKSFHLVTKEDAVQFLDHLKDLQTRRNTVAADLMSKINPGAADFFDQHSPPAQDTPSKGISLRLIAGKAK